MDLGYFHYLLFNMRYKIRGLCGMFTQKSCNRDDYNWDDYPDHYKFEESKTKKVNTIKISKDDYIFVDEKLKMNDNKNILPLHPNYRLIYETILQLSPTSVLEVGCGGGFHLYNLSVLDPKIQLYGVDISPRQIQLLHQRHKNLKANVQVLDITLPHPADSPVVDIAYTQAVIMHIKTKNNHLRAF